MKNSRQKQLLSSSVVLKHSTYNMLFNQTVVYKVVCNIPKWRPDLLLVRFVLLQTTALDGIGFFGTPRKDGGLSVLLA